MTRFSKDMKGNDTILDKFNFKHDEIHKKIQITRNDTISDISELVMIQCDASRHFSRASKLYFDIF